MICFLIGYQISGEEPWTYQLMNLLLHLANITLVYLFLTALVRNKSKENRAYRVIPIITAALFAVSPVHVESVAWVSENKNVLYTFFFLLSLLFYVRYSESDKRSIYLYSLLFFILSLLSKAQAVTLPVVMIIVDLFLGRRLRERKVLFEKIPFFSLSVGFGVLAIYAQGVNINIIEDVHEVQLNWIDKIAVAGYGFLQYLIKLVIPINLTPFYEYPRGDKFNLPLKFYIYTVFVIIGLVTFFLKLYKKPTFLFGSLFFIINIFLVLQLLPIRKAIIKK
jgi:hypothetical protein